MKLKELWIQSMIAGVCIGISGTIYLLTENKVVGALFFTLGLFTICTHGLHLFTGRIGYVFANPPSYSASLVITWLGNLIGTNLVALLLTFTRNASVLQKNALALCKIKLNDTLLSVFILGIFCNILMYIAVDGFRTNQHEIGKYLGLFLCVSGFIFAGFEHCIANMFFFGMADVWSVHTIIWLFAMTAGNIVGGILLPLCKRFIK